MKEYIKLGKEIRRLREAKGVSLRKMAEDIGIHFTHLSQIERGSGHLSDKVLYDIANYLGVEERLLFDIADRIPYTVLLALQKKGSIFKDLIYDLEKERNVDDALRLFGAFAKQAIKRGIITIDDIEQIRKEFIDVDGGSNPP